jgi:hypothetical protein
MWVIHSGEVNQGIIIVNVIKKAKITFQSISITRQKNIIWMKNQIRKLPKKKQAVMNRSSAFELFDEDKNRLVSTRYVLVKINQLLDSMESFRVTHPIDLF